MRARCWWWAVRILSEGSVAQGAGSRAAARVHVWVGLHMHPSCGPAPIRLTPSSRLPPALLQRRHPGRVAVRQPGRAPRAAAQPERAVEDGAGCGTRHAGESQPGCLPPWLVCPPMHCQPGSRWLNACALACRRWRSTRRRSCTATSSPATWCVPWLQGLCLPAPHPLTALHHTNMPPALRPSSATVHRQHRHRQDCRLWAGAHPVPRRHGVADGGDGFVPVDGARGHQAREAGCVAGLQGSARRAREPCWVPGLSCASNPSKATARRARRTLHPLCAQARAVRRAQRLLVVWRDAGGAADAAEAVCGAVHDPGAGGHPGAGGGAGGRLVGRAVATAACAVPCQLRRVGLCWGCPAALNARTPPCLPSAAGGRRQPAPAGAA